MTRPEPLHDMTYDLLIKYGCKVVAIIAPVFLRNHVAVEMTERDSFQGGW